MVAQHSPGWRIMANDTSLSWLQIGSKTMDSHRSYWNSSMQSSTWLEGEDQDVYEVESRVPLPRPFPLSSTLNTKNAVVIQTQISHVNHKTNGHLLKVISKISLPTPPYTVSYPTLELYCIKRGVELLYQLSRAYVKLINVLWIHFSVFL